MNINSIKKLIHILVEHKKINYNKNIKKLALNVTK